MFQRRRNDNINKICVLEGVGEGENVCEILGGIHLCANTCRVCIRTPANTGKYSWHIIYVLVSCQGAHTKLRSHCTNRFLVLVVHNCLGQHARLMKHQLLGNYTFLGSRGRPGKKWVSGPLPEIEGFGPLARNMKELALPGKREK